MFFNGGELIINNVSAMVNAMTIKERGDGRFEGRITVNGIRKSFYGNNKSIVKNKAKDYLMRIENGFREPKKILFDDYANYWLKEFKWNKIEPTSYTRLYRTYECRIKNYLGNKKIGEITTKDIQSLIDMYANPPSGKIKALSLSGLKRVFDFIRPCLNNAVREELIYKNPCDGVLIPKESCIEVDTKVQFSLSDSEISEFRKEALKRYKTTGEYCSRDAFILLFMINTGLRVGEALALQWKDIDFSTNLLYVNKTIQSNIANFDGEHGKNTTYNRLKESTKTEAGVRVIKLNENALWYINELKEYDKRKRIVSNNICCTKEGTLVTSRNLQRSLDRIVKRTGIEKRVTLHTLRHTFGSTLLRRGVNIAVVSKIMGHANITITMKKYIHVLQEEEAKAMNMVKVC